MDQVGWRGMIRPSQSQASIRSSRPKGTAVENAMQRLRTERPMQNHVRAVFEASALSFELPPAATLEDLAGRLARLSERYDGALIRVDVRVNR